MNWSIFTWMASKQAYKYPFNSKIVWQLNRRVNIYALTTKQNEAHNNNVDKDGKQGAFGVSEYSFQLNYFVWKRNHAGNLELLLEFIGMNVHIPTSCRKAFDQH